LDTQSNWTGPESVGIGQTPSSAGGSGGLYLLSADGSLASNPDDPTAVDVRSYNATSHTFNAPVTLLSNPESGFDEGGGIAETPGGKVVAIWPDVSAGGTDVLDSFVSTNSGASFTPAYIATRSGYGGQASVAATDTSTGVEGVVAFNDDGGLELANLTPLPPGPPPPPPPPPTPQKTTPPPRGAPHPHRRHDLDRSSLRNARRRRHLDYRRHDRRDRSGGCQRNERDQRDGDDGVRPVLDVDMHLQPGVQRHGYGLRRCCGRGRCGHPACAGQVLLAGVVRRKRHQRRGRKRLRLGGADRHPGGHDRR
jgi:hypothetical protein